MAAAKQQLKKIFVFVSNIAASPPEILFIIAIIFIFLIFKF